MLLRGYFPRRVQRRPVGPRGDAALAAEARVAFDQLVHHLVVQLGEMLLPAIGVHHANVQQGAFACVERLEEFFAVRTGFHGFWKRPLSGYS